MLNSVEWKYFKLEDLFEVEKLPNTVSKRAEGCISNTNKNTIAYVTRSVNNNGVKFFCNKGLIEKEGIKIFKKNAIIIGGEATECFYIEGSFITGNNVSILTNNHLNKYVGLFISTIIDKEFYRYNYGRGFTMTRIRNTSIKLPVDSNGDPNWEFMEDYMKKISRGNLDGFNLPKNDVRLSLDDREWDEFKLEDLFEISISRSLNKSDVVEVNSDMKNTINYVSRTRYDNGVLGVVEKLHDSKYINPSNSISIPMVGNSTLYCSYQEKEYVGSQNLGVIRNNFLNKYNGLFIVSILSNERYRYSYGRTLNLKHLEKTIIKLPIKPKTSPDEKSDPDWKFMEDYIKGLPYTNKL